MNVSALSSVQLFAYAQRVLTSNLSGQRDLLGSQDVSLDYYKVCAIRLFIQ